MIKRSKQEYLAEIRERYRGAGKKEQGSILNEFTRVCSYNRKYAIRLLNTPLNKIYPRSVTAHGKRTAVGRPKVYDTPELEEFLRVLWGAMNQACSKRLKAAIPHWLPHHSEAMKKTLSLTQQVLCTRMAHCGSSAAGTFIYTVNSTDIATGWMEARAVWGKGETGVFEAIRHIEATLLFPLRGFDADNGGEFINHHLMKYFTGRTRPVDYTRSREYRKNDNAHIEGKNWTHIRQYLGYRRFECNEMVTLMNDLYCNEFGLLVNFFLPSVKLQSKQRIGSHIHKKHDAPKTPYQRLLESKDIPDKSKSLLKNRYT